MSSIATSAMEPAVVDIGDVPKRSSSISPVAWTPIQELDFSEWATAGRRLSAMGRCGQWGLGDWIRYGNRRFGERYAWAARVTAYDVQTLMNMVYVASRFEISRRRENLSWSHHETLAALEPREQDVWLDRAVVDKLSISDLRGEMRSRRRHSKGGSGDRQSVCGASTSQSVIVCPHCGGKVPLPNTGARHVPKRPRITGGAPPLVGQ
jgi:hypothetical protein